MDKRLKDKMVRYLATQLYWFSAFLNWFRHNCVTFCLKSVTALSRAVFMVNRNQSTCYVMPDLLHIINYVLDPRSSRGWRQIRIIFRRAYCWQWQDSDIWGSVLTCTSRKRTLFLDAGRNYGSAVPTPVGHLTWQVYTDILWPVDQFCDM